LGRHALGRRRRLIIIEVGQQHGALDQRGEGGDGGDGWTEAIFGKTGGTNHSRDLARQRWVALNAEP